MDIKDLAFKKFIDCKLMEMVNLDQEELDELAQQWLHNSDKQEKLTDFYVRIHDVEFRNEFDERYVKPSWAARNLSRHHLQEWCDVHGYDFLTLCRILDDYKIRV